MMDEPDLRSLEDPPALRVARIIAYKASIDVWTANVIGRAVIEALRVPTSAMIDAAHARLAGDGDVEAVYTAMIDAALQATAGSGSTP